MGIADWLKFNHVAKRSFVNFVHDWLSTFFIAEEKRPDAPKKLLKDSCDPAT